MKIFLSWLSPVFLVPMLLLGSFTATAYANLAPVVDEVVSDVETSAAEQPVPEAQDGVPAQEITMASPSAVSDNTVLPREPAPAPSFKSTLQSSNIEQISHNPFKPDDSLPVGQRVKALEQQMENLTTDNYKLQLADIRQQLQEINGQLQVQEHDLKLLSHQQHSFYQDLDRRVKRLETLGHGSTNDESDRSYSSPIPAKGNPMKSASLKEWKAYKKAFAHVSQHQFSKASEGFKHYLQAYPEGKLRANAHYWLGEIQLRENHPENALTHFKWVIANTPKSPKVPDARLKLAVTEAGLGRTDLAKKGFLAIKKEYPGTTASQLASIQLQRLK